MRIKLKPEQLNILAQQPRDVRGMLELLGRDMPCDEIGFSKFGDESRRPPRLNFSVEATQDGYICDIHPALAQHIHTLLSSE